MTSLFASTGENQTAGCVGTISNIGTIEGGGGPSQISELSRGGSISNIGTIEGGGPSQISELSRGGS